MIYLTVIIATAFLLVLLVKYLTKEEIEKKDVINKEKVKTQYRTVNDGYRDFLQYKSLWGWKYIWKPYYNTYTMSEGLFGGGMDHEVYQCDYHGSEFSNKDFIEKYPYIEDYFIYANQEQDRLNQKYRKMKQERENKKNKITYL